MRTTVDIETSVLKDLKRIRQREGKPLGRIISDLLAQALAERKSTKAPAKPPKWISKSMGARVDVADHEALYAVMESEPPPYKSSQPQ